MSRVLFIDDDPVARKAMEGIISRSPHDVIGVDNPSAAQALMLNRLDFEIVIAELKFEGGESLQPWLKFVRNNPFLKILPVVVCSKIRDRKQIKPILDSGVQNFLFKPYKEKQIFEEIEKVPEQDWRLRLAGTKPEALEKLIKEQEVVALQDQSEFYEAMVALQQKLMNSRSPAGVTSLSRDLNQMVEESQKQLYPRFGDYLEAIMLAANQDKSAPISALMSFYESALSLQKHRMRLIEDALKLPSGPVSDEVKAKEAKEKEEEEKKEIENVKRYELSEVKLYVENLSNYPVVESAAAAFQMATNEEETNLDDIVGMIERDAGLAASVLRFSNSPTIAPKSVIEDIHQAISVLGLKRVRLLALSLQTLPELNNMLTAFRWQDFWMHQVGCAMLTEEIVKRLDLPCKPEMAYLAGLVLDMGKLLLCHMDGAAYKAAVAVAAQRNMPLQHSEKIFFNCSHEFAGLAFAKQSQLGKPLQIAIEYQFKPTEAPKHHELVGPVCLANYLCMENKIGSNGDRVETEGSTLGSHPAWQILEPWLPPSFSVTHFSKEIQGRIRSLRSELLGMVREKMGGAA